jgi:hypothetical protein
VIASLVAATLTSGCAGPVEVTHVLTGPPLPSRSEGAALPVFINEVPDVPYREVAQIRVRSTGATGDVHAVLSAAERDAREVGADAIIVDLRRHYHSVQVWLGCDRRLRVDPEWRLNARVTAIRFVPPGAASPEPAPTGTPVARETCE